MKKIFVVSMLACSGILVSGVNASALVMVINMGCSPLHYKGTNLPQANAPRFSLACGVTESFGPTTMNCTASEFSYFPPPARNQSIPLTQVAETNSTRVFKGAQNITVVVAEGKGVKAELSYFGLVSECSQIPQ